MKFIYFFLILIFCSCAERRDFVEFTIDHRQLQTDGIHVLILEVKNYSKDSIVWHFPSINREFHKNFQPYLIPGSEIPLELFFDIEEIPPPPPEGYYKNEEKLTIKRYNCFIKKLKQINSSLHLTDSIIKIFNDKWSISSNSCCSSFDYQTVIINPQDTFRYHLGYFKQNEILDSLTILHFNAPDLDEPFPLVDTLIINQDTLYINVPYKLNPGECYGLQTVHTPETLYIE